MMDHSQTRSSDRHRFSRSVVASVFLARKGNASFIIGLVAGLMLWLGAWILLIVGQLGQAHPDNVWVKEAYQLKIAAAERKRGMEKVLVVGGSATMFGVDSEQLAADIGKPVVNLGVNAGIGTNEVPRLIDRVLERGDLVVMPLEYRLLLWDGVPSYVTLSWALEHPAALSRWRLLTFMWGLWSLPVDRVFQGYQGFTASSSRGPYGAHNLTALGDQTNTAASLRTDAQLRALKALPPERYDVLYRKSSVGLEEWSHWWLRWQARGVCLVVVPPPFMFVNDYNTAAFSAFFDEIPGRVGDRGVSYLGHPEDGFFPVEAMFDTNYHLTAESRVEYTQWLAGTLLSRDVKCPLATTDSGSE